MSTQPSWVFVVLMIVVVFVVIGLFFLALGYREIVR